MIVLTLYLLLVIQGDGDQERLKRQQELTALNLYQLQQLQYQYHLRYSGRTSDTLLSDITFTQTQIQHPSFNFAVIDLSNLFFYINISKESIKTIFSHFPCSPAFLLSGSSMLMPWPSRKLQPLAQLLFNSSSSTNSRSTCYYSNTRHSR